MPTRSRLLDSRFSAYRLPNARFFAARLARPICAGLIAGTVLQAQALSKNPIDQSLPLSEHAWVTCPQGLNDGFVVTNPVWSHCSGSYSVSYQPALAHVDGSGVATADLASGQLKVQASGQTYDGLLPAGVEVRANGGAAAKLYDTLTVHGSWTGALYSELHMDVDGHFSGNPNILPYTYPSAVTASLVTLTQTGQFSQLSTVAIGQTVSDDHQTAVFYLSTAGGQYSTNANAKGEFDPLDARIHLVIPIYLYADVPTFSFVASLGALAAPAVGVLGVDFGNTAKLSLVLPQGYTYTSTSGVFLSAVPEPGSAWLLGFGLLPLAWRRLRAPDADRDAAA